jgi:hypothetical protein
MVNKFNRKDQEDYDYVDKSGKGWRLKKGESMDDLKLRAQGKKNGK